MILLQFSAGQGPAECQLAVVKAVAYLEKEANSQNVAFSLLESENGREPHTLRSATVSLAGKQAQALADRWCGSIQWIYESPYRHKYPRKNWFIGCVQLDTRDELPDSAIRFETMRSNGAGGQHVNKTDSAVRATHLATGVSVKVQSERSQHANKRLASLLLQAKLAELAQTQQAVAKRERWHWHYDVERGNPVRIFKGKAFKLS